MPFDKFPHDLPLRERLPAMRPETISTLTTWGLAQVGAMPWLLQRAEAYWSREDIPVSVCANFQAFDARHQILDATAALDLMKWRVGTKDDKAALEQIRFFNETAKPI